MRPRDYCRDAAAPPGSSLHYATLFQTLSERRVLYALFALLAETDAASRALPEPSVSRAKLHWWIEQLGRGTEERAAHPVLAELAWAARSMLGLDSELRACVASLAALSGSAPRTFDEWIAGHAAGQGRVWGVSARLCGTADAEAAPVQRIGMLVAAVEDIRQLPLCLRAGRCPLPLDDLERAGLSAATLSDPARAEALAHCLDGMLSTIRSDLLRAESELALAHARPLLYARIMALLGAALCVELAIDGPLVLRRRTSLTPLRKLLIAVRTRLSA